MLDSRQEFTRILSNLYLKAGEIMNSLYEPMKGTLDGMALKLVLLAGIIFVCMAVVVLIIKLIPALRSINNFLLGLAGLLGLYIWLQIYFL